MILFLLSLFVHDAMKFFRAHQHSLKTLSLLLHLITLVLVILVEWLMLRSVERIIGRLVPPHRGQRSKLGSNTWRTQAAFNEFKDSILYRHQQQQQQQRILDTRWRPIRGSFESLDHKHAQWEFFAHFLGVTLAIQIDIDYIRTTYIKINNNFMFLSRLVRFRSNTEVSDDITWQRTDWFNYYRWM